MFQSSQDVQRLMTRLSLNVSTATEAFPGSLTGSHSSRLATISEDFLVCKYQLTNLLDQIAAYLSTTLQASEDSYQAYSQRQRTPST